MIICILYKETFLLQVPYKDLSLLPLIGKLRKI